MVPDDADEVPEARPPLLADPVALCRDLNAVGAAYRHQITYDERYVWD
jgi:hypothetical protein